jgi:endonuclease/exonuclease/phosphatase (EEP) superfamily protein YafD
MRRAAPWILAAPWIAWALGRTFAVDEAIPAAAAVLAFTPYAAVTAAIPLIVALALRRWRLAAATLVAAALLAGAVVPRAIDDIDTQPRGYEPITVLSSNLYLGRGDTADVLRLARREKADVLVLLEISAATLDRANVAGLRTQYPHAMAEPRPGGTGAAIFSRLPLTEIRPTTTARYPGPTADVELPGGRTVRIQAVHPPPPVGREQSRTWRGELRKLPAGPRTDRPSILAGDFNATLDHHELRRILGKGYTDAAAALGEGLKPTWPVGRTALPITIDHVLATSQLEPQRYTTTEISRSDHRAITARFAVR